MRTLYLNNIRYDCTKIGKGSFSVVYLAKNINTGINYAIKEIKVKRWRHIKYIKNEHKCLMACQNNENIIKYIGYAKCCNSIIQHIPIRYFIFEYGDDTLQNILSKQNVDEINIFRQCANALRYVHKLNIIHSDIKLDNFIMVDNTVKLIDFGLSFKWNNTKKTHVIGGTLECMSPEAYCVHNGYNMFITPKTDVWSLGVMMYKFYTKKQLLSKAFVNCRYPTKKSILDYFNTLVIRTYNELEEIITLCLRIDSDSRCSANDLYDHLFAINIY